MATVAEIAAYLGVTCGYVRQIISEQRIQAAGRKGRANLYWVIDITRHTGHRDRLAQAADLH